MQQYICDNKQFSADDGGHGNKPEWIVGDGTNIQKQISKKFKEPVNKQSELGRGDGTNKQK